MAKAETQAELENPETSTALTVLQDTYPALVTAGGSGASNLAPGEEVTPFDLDRIRVPGAGGMTWEIGDDYPRTFDAIILHQRLIRTYWHESFDTSGGGSAPTCSSPDSLVGVGDPGGSCKTCPLAQWGSAESGNGQACRLIRAMFLALPGKEMPVVLMAPPSSVKTTKKYLLSLSGRGVPYQGVVTTFGLEKAQSSGGIEYSQIVPRIGRVLEPAEVAAVRQSIQSLQEIFASDIQETVTMADVDGGECDHPDDRLSYTQNGFLACAKCGARWSQAQAEAVMAGR